MSDDINIYPLMTRTYPLPTTGASAYPAGFAGETWHSGRPAAAGAAAARALPIGWTPTDPDAPYPAGGSPGTSGTRDDQRPSVLQLLILTQSAGRSGCHPLHGRGSPETPGTRNGQRLPLLQLIILAGGHNTLGRPVATSAASARAPPNRQGADGPGRSPNPPWFAR